MKERIARSVFWLAWSRGVVQAVSFLSTVLVARLLSPADYGLMALATIWTGTLALVADAGLGAAIIQFPDLEAGELNLCLWLNMALATTGYAALWAAAPAIATWFSTPRLSAVLRVAGIVLPLTALRLVPDGLLRKRLEIDKVSQAEVAGVLATIPVVLTLAWHGAGVWALVAGALALPLVQMVVVFRFVRWRPGLHLRSTRFKALMHYGLGAWGTRVAAAASDQLDIFLVGKVAGGGALGFYSMAKTLAILPVIKISVMANQLAVPVMAELQTDRGALRVSFLRGLRCVACLTVPACVGAMLVADDLVTVALGPKWHPMVPLLQVLAIFGLIRSLAVLLPPILFARYRTAFLSWWTGALFLVMLPAFWAGAAWLGGLGVALAWIAVYPIILAWMAREALRELETDWKIVRDALRPVMAATLVMMGVVMIVRWSMPGSDFFERLVRLGLASTLGAAVYAGSIFWQGGALVGEVREVAGWLLRRPAGLAGVADLTRRVPGSPVSG